MKLVDCARLGGLWIALAWTGMLSQAVAQDGSAEATRQFNMAVALQNQGEYELAAEAWTRFLSDFKADPRCDRASHYLGVCYLKAEKPQQAQESFQAVVTNYPNSEKLEESYYLLGVAQYTLGQQGKAESYDAAVATFDALLAKFPKGKYVAQAIFYRGECFYARGNKQEAAAMYAQLAEKHPESDLLLDAIYALGVTQEELGRHAEAGKTYDAFLAKFAKTPLGSEVVMRRAEIFMVQQQYETAAGWFASAAAKEGFALADYATLRQAAALAQLNKVAEAAALYASVVQKWPDSSHVEAASLGGGKCYYLAGNFAEARKLLGKVLQLGGGSAAEAAHWIARSLLKERQPAEALAVVEKVLPGAASGPLAPQLLMDQADAVYEIPERRGESAALFAALAKNYPDDASAPQALYMAAFAALGQRDYRAALDHATAFLNRYVGNELAADVTYIAAESRLQLSDYAEAEKLFAELLQKYPGHAEIETWTVRRGLALHVQKKYAETIAAMTPALEGLKSPDALAEANYLVGSSRAELKEYAAAAGALEASLAAQPAWRQADDALLVLAHCCSQLQQLDKAKAAVGRLIAEFPESRQLDRAHYRLGEYHFAAGDPKAAAAEYRKVLDAWPQSAMAPYAQYGLGWAQLNAGDPAGAEQTIDALLKGHADFAQTPRARYARGMARHQLRKFAPAIEDLEALLAADPTAAEKSDARYVLGLCRVGLKQFAEAAAAFEQLLGDDPKYAGADKALYELAWAWKEQDKEKESAETFARLAAEHPDSPLAAESQYHAGEWAYKSEDFQKAAAAYEQAQQKAGKTALGEKASHKLGWACFRLDDLAKAQQTFAAQRAAWPDGPLAGDAAFMEAECLFKEKKYQEALAVYEQVSNPSGKDFQTLALLHGAQAAGQLQQWAKSLAMAVRCAEESPDSPYLPEALYEQGWAQQNLDKLDLAKTLYESVIAKTNREVAARAQFMIGEIEFQQKQHAEAIKSFFKVGYGYGYPKWQADAMYEAGRCFEVLGKRPQAAKQYQELIDKFPESDKVPLAKKRVEELKGQP